MVVRRELVTLTSKGNRRRLASSNYLDHPGCIGRFAESCVGPSVRRNRIHSPRRFLTALGALTLSNSLMCRRNVKAVTMGIIALLGLVVITASASSVVSATSATATTASPIAWSAPTDIDASNFLKSVSCASASFCMAVDLQGNALAWDGNLSFGTHPVFPSQFAFFYDVSCPSASFCMAVESNNAFVWNGTSWSTAMATPDFYDLDSISCPSASFCMAVDDDGNALAWDGISWSAPVPIDKASPTHALSRSLVPRHRSAWQWMTLATPWPGMALHGLHLTTSMARDWLQLGFVPY